MKQITIRGITADLARALQEEKKRRGTSLNQAVLELLRQSLGLQSGRYENGLAKFAATWTPKDLLDFEHSIEIFERVDPELWK